MMRLAERVAVRYFFSLTRKPTVIPEGSSQTPVGPFQLFVAPDRLKHEPAAIKALEVTEREFKAAGLPLRGKVWVVLLGSVRRSYYSPQEGLIRLAVMNLNRDGVGTLLHEATHWQHATQVPSGTGNRLITDKYAEAMRIKSAPGSGSTKDQWEKKLRQTKSKIKDVDAQIAAPPVVNKGDVFTVDFGGVPIKVQVLRVLRDGAQVKFVETTDYTNKYWPEGKVKLQAESLDRALGASAKDALKAQRAALFEEAREAYENYNGVTDRIDAVMNEWVPTRYSRESASEWFAELVMTRVLKPALVTDEVKDWIKHVW